MSGCLWGTYAMDGDKDSGSVVHGVCLPISRGIAVVIGRYIGYGPRDPLVR